MPPNAGEPAARSSAAQAVGRAVRRTWLGRRWLKAGLAAVAVTGALLVVEGALRIRQYRRYGTWQPHVYGFALEVDPEIGIALPRSNVQMSGSEINMQVNSLGFRGREISRAKPPGTIRIACLGASTTYCAEVPSDDATWPAQLERVLQERYPRARFEVVNAGIPGCRAEHTRVQLERRVLPLEPDLVIEYEGYNDLKQAIRETAKQQGLLATGRHHQSPAVLWLSHRSVLANLLEHNGRLWLARYWRYPRLPEVPADLPRPMIEEFEAMDELLGERQIPWVISLFLAKYRPGQSPAELNENTAHARYFTPWLDSAALLEATELYNDAMRQFGHRHGVPVIEDLATVPGDSVHFSDSVHLTAVGCQAMAVRLADALEDHGLLSPLVERAAAETASRRRSDL